WFHLDEGYAEHVLDVVRARLLNRTGAGRYCDMGMAEGFMTMYTGDWWYEEQEKIPIGSTLVPILFAIDGTQLSTHSGDHELRPLYMSVGNLPSSLRSRPLANS